MGLNYFFEGGNASALLRPSGTEPAGKPYTFMSFPYEEKNGPRETGSTLCRRGKHPFRSLATCFFPIASERPLYDEDEVPPAISSPVSKHEITAVDLSSPNARERFEQVSRDELYFWAKAQKGDERATDALHFLEKARVLAEKNSAGRLYMMKIQEGKDLVPAGIAVVDAKEDPRGGLRVEVDISPNVTDTSVTRELVLKIVKDHPSAGAIYFHPEIPERKGKIQDGDTSSLVRLLQTRLNFKDVGGEISFIWETRPSLPRR